MCNVYDSYNISHSLPDVHKTSLRVGKVGREDAQKCFSKTRELKAILRLPGNGKTKTKAIAKYLAR